MKTDVIDHDDHYEVVSELPGFQKQDIDIQYSDDTLSIHAVHDLKKKKFVMMMDMWSIRNVGQAMLVGHSTYRMFKKIKLVLLTMVVF